ncbi:hypothetical protein ES703_90530 [subsurface metagenome]
MSALKSRIYMEVRMVWLATDKQQRLPGFAPVGRRALPSICAIALDYNIYHGIYYVYGGAEFLILG